MYWSGVDYLWIIVMFLSAVWTLILTAPIHCRWSIAEQVMECYISPNLMKKTTHLYLGLPEGESKKKILNSWVVLSDFTFYQFSWIWPNQDKLEIIQMKESHLSILVKLHDNPHRIFLDNSYKSHNVRMVQFLHDHCMKTMIFIILFRHVLDSTGERWIVLQASLMNFSFTSAEQSLHVFTATFTRSPVWKKTQDSWGFCPESWA